MVASALAISWSDPTGCDGIAADLKTFGAFAIHGAGIIAAIRTNGTLAPIPASNIEAQIKAAVSGLGAAPAKINFFGIPEIDSAIANALASRGVSQFVIDASSTASVGQLSREAADAFKAKTAPKLTILVTDVAGAQVLAGVKIANQSAMRAVAKLLVKSGPRFVLITGSQLPGDDVTDIMFDGSQAWEFPSERFPTPEPSGLSSTYASAITAGLAHGRSVEESVAIARIYATEAERAGFAVNEKRLIPSQLYAWWSGPGRQGYGG